MSTKDRTDSIWEKVQLLPFQSLEENKEVETCIIGGGITGLAMAYQMAKRGHKVMLVEAFRLASGQTGRTTAHLTCQLETPFKDLLKIHDVKTVSAFLDAHRNAIDVIEEIISIEGISCDFKRVDGFLFQGENFDKKNLQQEKVAAAKCGLNLDFIEVTPLLNESVSSLRFPRQAQFDPLKFMQGLIRVLKELDVEIFEGTHISDIRQEERGHWVLTTDEEVQIRTSHLIVATNTPVNNRFHIHTKQYAYRTYAMAFKVSIQHKEECLLWDTNDPYHYIRFVEDTLVIGGEDHRTGQDPLHDPFASLEAWSREKFPFIKELAWKWSGQVFEPMDQIAFIGRNPGIEKNCFISTGQSGIGITSGIIASLIIPDLIDKGSHPWAGIFDPGRPPVKGLKEFFHENANVAYQYKDWLTGSEVNNEEEIPQDSGSVIREGLLMKSCVYHDEADHFEKRSAVCPHLGGIVHWNAIEKTWDCPCHGSRFNTKGSVIEGPSLSGLSET
jgi:glycine/D-amino acid oxidase-like deaminating enzyme/nitrite reductase/ring-hydroxylating ferredoxin subunit